MALTAKQKGVAGGMAAGFVASLAGLLGAPYWLPWYLGGQPGEASIKWFALVVPVVYAVGRLASFRFFHANDIDAAVATAPASDRARELQAMLQNTLEQTVIAMFAITLPAPPFWLNFDLFDRRPLAVAILFLIGRIAFFAGYARGAAARSFGFALTFYPSFMLLVLNLWVWFYAIFVMHWHAAPTAF